MSHIKPTRTEMFNGLRRRPKYEEISQEINPDKTKIKYPDRNAKFLREDPRMTQLDGVGFFESMQNQEEATIKEQRRDTTLRQIAKDNKTGMAEAKATEPAKTTATEFFDISHDDEHMPADEEQVAQELEGANIHSKTRKEKVKEKLRTRFVKIRTQETAIMKPGTSEMGTNTAQSTKAIPIETQTEPATATPIATQTFPLDAMATSGNKKKIKQTIRDVKERKERKQKGLAKVLETQLKSETMQIEPEPPQTIPEARGRGRSRSPKPRGRPPKKEDVKMEEPAEKKRASSINKESDEAKKGRTTKPNERKRAPDKYKEADDPKKGRTTKSVPVPEPKPAPNPPPTTTQPIPKAKAKAKAVPKIPGVPKPAVIPDHDIDTDNNIDIEHWKKKGLGWIKEQLQLRGVKITIDQLKTQYLDERGKVIKDKTKAVKTKPPLTKEDLVQKVMDLVTAKKWIKKKQ